MEAEEDGSDEAGWKNLAGDEEECQVLGGGADCEVGKEEFSFFNSLAVDVYLLYANKQANSSVRL